MEEAETRKWLLAMQGKAHRTRPTRFACVLKGKPESGIVNFESEEIKMFEKFRVEVKCLSNGYVAIYKDCVKITQGMFWDDDSETNICGMRLTFADGSTATFRDGFEIKMYV